MYEPVSVAGGSSSYWLDPADSLDPVLFDGSRMKAGIRQELMGTIRQFLDATYMGSEQWLRVWLAGSGASFRWHAEETGKDLDILLGVDFVGFRKANEHYRGMGDAEIASHLNDEMRTHLWPYTADWMGRYEVTWYVNPRSQDIRDISPYAAYDLVADAWTVPPSKDAPVVTDEWEGAAESWRLRAKSAVQRYSSALTEVQNASSAVQRVNAEGRFRLAVEQAATLYDVVHQGRKTAFSPIGAGYDDISNYLWQTGKQEGWVQALRSIKDYHVQAQQALHEQTYGVALPDADTLVRRAALHGRIDLR